MNSTNCLLHDLPSQEIWATVNSKPPSSSFCFSYKKVLRRFSLARPNLWNGHPSEACSGSQGHAQRVDGHARQGLGQARSNFLHFCRTSPVSQSWERSPSPPWSPGPISGPTWNSRSHLAVGLQSATTTDISSFHEQGSESE